MISVSWIKCGSDGYCDLELLDLRTITATTGVYAIWHEGNPAVWSESARKTSPLAWALIARTRRFWLTRSMAGFVSQPYRRTSLMALSDIWRTRGLH
jgi:hypothetical protein